MIFLLFILFAGLLRADGGTPIFHRPAGDFDVTIFNSSDKVRAGKNDLSVLVQRQSDHSTVMDATVLLHLERAQPTGEIMRLTGIANHKNATNKTLYATNLNIPSTGIWRLTVDVTAAGHNASATGALDVFNPLPPGETYWPYMILVPLLGIAFLINRKLRERFRRRT